MSLCCHTEYHCIGMTCQLELSPNNYLSIQECSPKQLLVLCAMAIENKNRSAAQLMVCALRNKASFEGDPTERVTAYFLQALVLRAGILLTPNLPFTNDVEYSRFYGKYSGRNPHFAYFSF